MPWDYRLMHQLRDGEDIFGIHEVYYDEQGNVKNWTINTLGPQGETYEELIEDLSMWMTAFDKPLLDEAELEKRT
jgi:hypothetical protein